MIIQTLRNISEKAAATVRGGSVVPSRLTVNETGEVVNTKKVTGKPMKNIISNIQAQVGNGQVTEQVKSTYTGVKNKATGILQGKNGTPISGGINFGGQAVNPTLVIGGGILAALLIAFGAMKALSTPKRRRR